MSATPVAVDLVIEARWVVPIEPAATTVEDHAIVVNGGRIVDLLPQSAARQRYVPAAVTSLPEHVVLPGLVNLHTHAAMSLMRGLADDIALMDWLQNHIWPAEARHVSAAFVADGTRLAAAEMLRGGVTCFNDMYFYPGAAIEASIELGIRIAAGILAIDFPSTYASDVDDYLAKGLATRDEYRDHRLVHFCLAPHAPYTVADPAFRRVVTLAEQLQIPIHIHVHETTAEIHDSQAAHGERPLERLQRLGVLSPFMIGVHAVHLEPEEIAVLAHQGCAIAHCPSSNLKLGSGIAPLAELLAAGINVGLGTDGAASNNRLDLWQEMRLAALLAKGRRHDARLVDAHQALHLATLGGARALALDDRIGSIVPGKEADLCAVRLDQLEQQPCYDVASHLVYVTGREHVSHVWVAGVLCAEHGRLTRIDDEVLMRCANSWQNKISLRNPL